MHHPGCGICGGASGSSRVGSRGSRAGVRGARVAASAFVCDEEHRREPPADPGHPRVFRPQISFENPPLPSPLLPRHPGGALPFLPSFLPSEIGDSHAVVAAACSDGGGARAEHPRTRPAPAWQSEGASSWGWGSRRPRRGSGAARAAGCGAAGTGSGCRLAGARHRRPPLSWPPPRRCASRCAGCVKTWGRRSAPAAATVEDVGMVVCAGGDGREKASSPPLPFPPLSLPSQTSRRRPPLACASWRAPLREQCLFECRCTQPLRARPASASARQGGGWVFAQNKTCIALAGI
jgi:hypothetical protein